MAAAANVEHDHHLPLIADLDHLLLFFELKSNWKEENPMVINLY